VPLNASFDRVTIEPGKMGGKPCIRNYPDLKEDDLRQSLAFAAANLEGRIGSLRVILTT
jgi:uncharacterized protein (DUF433 family)